MSDSEMLDFLKDPNLLNNIVKAVQERGVIGEEMTIKTQVIVICGKLVINKDSCSTNLHPEDRSGIGKDYVTERVMIIVFSKDWIKYNSPTNTAISYSQRKIKKQIELDEDKKPVFEYVTIGKEITEDSILYIKDASDGFLNGDDCKLLFEEIDVNLAKTIQGGDQITLKWKKPVVIITTAETNSSNQIIRRLPSLGMNSSKEQTQKIVQYHLESNCDIATKKENYNEKLVETAQKSFYELKKVYVDLKKVKHLIEEKMPKNDSLLMRSLAPRLNDFIKFSTALHQCQRENVSDIIYYANEQDVEIGFQIFNHIYKTDFADITTLNTRQRNIRKKFRDNPNRLYSMKEIEIWKEAGGVTYQQLIQKDLPGIMRVDSDIKILDEHKPYKFAYSPSNKVDLDDDSLYR